MKAKIIDFCIIDNENNPNTLLHFNNKFAIYMKVEFFEDIETPIFAFTLKDAKGLEITGTNTLMKNVHVGPYKSGDVVSVVFEQNANIQVGTYALSLGCVNVGGGVIEVYERIYDGLFFDVVGSEQMVGFYDLLSNVRIETVKI